MFFYVSMCVLWFNFIQMESFFYFGHIYIAYNNNFHPFFLYLIKIEETTGKSMIFNKMRLLIFFIWPDIIHLCQSEALSCLHHQVENSFLAMFKFFFFISYFSNKKKGSRTCPIYITYHCIKIKSRHILAIGIGNFHQFAFLPHSI